MRCQLRKSRIRYQKLCESTGKFDTASKHLLAEELTIWSHDATSVVNLKVKRANHLFHYIVYNFLCSIRTIKQVGRDDTIVVLNDQVNAEEF